MTFPITPFYRPEHRPNPMIGVLKHRENKRLEIAQFFPRTLGADFRAASCTTPSAHRSAPA
jgi:hypothetical protein